MRVGRWVRAVPDGVQFLRALAWLRRSQWMAPERMRAFQKARLRRLVEHAYTHTAFYRRRLDEAGIRPSAIDSLGALERLPLLTREDIVAHRTDLTADSARRYRPETAYTSGTTGSRLQFLRDQRTIRMANAAMWRFEGWHGARWGHRRAEIRAPQGMEGPTRFTRSHGSPTLVINVTSPHVTPKLAAAALAEFKPEVILVRTPSWFTYLCLYLPEHRGHGIRPRVIFTRGERVLPEQRQVMSDAFGARVVDVYATLEYALFGGECEHGRMHAAPEMGIMEIRRDGRRAPDGEEGTLVLTSLWNHAFPFIRYDIGDVAAVEPGVCGCGRTLPMWRIVGGRRRDLIATPKGYLYLPTYLLAAPKWRGKLAGYQFVQETRDSITAQIVRGPAYSDADTETLRSELTALFDRQLDVSIAFFDSIEKTAGGKFRYVVSKVPLEV